MKTIYSRPAVVNAGTLEVSSSLKDSAFPAAVAAIVGSAVGYAAGRAITNAIKASPSEKLPSLTKFEGD